MNTEELYQVYLKNREVCTDTRQIKPGCIYFALKGDNFDGNLFAEKALEEGASFAVIDNEKYSKDERYILVYDVLIALQNLAKYHREQLKIPVVGITGSNGKTTTKELLYSVLSQHCRTHATKGNLNNHIGVPLTILAIPESTDIAIIEMGANHQKEIEFLCSISQPSHGLITNIGKAHLEGFGGIEGVKKGKGELYDYLKKTDGTVFVNSDNYLLVDLLRDKNINKIVFYGKTADNFISGNLITEFPYLEVGWHREAMELDDQTHTCKSNLSGIYNLENILSAVCVGTFFKLDPEQVNRGIEVYQPQNFRSQIKKTQSNTLICDYYNANPSSMQVAIDNLISLKAEHKVLILADMFEMGKDAEKEHQLIAGKALHMEADLCIFIGEEFYKFKDESAQFYKTTQDAYEALKANPIKNSTILIKGSRGMKLETLVELL